MSLLALNSKLKKGDAARTPASPFLRKEEQMGFFKLLNILGTVLAWIIVLAVVWATAPVIMKLFTVAQQLHDFGK